MKLLFLCSLYTILAAPVYDDYNRNFDLEDTIGNSKYADFGDSDFVDPDLIESDLVESDYLVDSSVEIGSIVFVDLASCNAQSILSVSSFLVTPDPPKVGQNLTIIASGILSSPIVNGATLHITVKLGFISLLDQTQNLCDLTGENGIKCPISVGQHDIKAGFPIPAIAPKVII